MYIIDFSKLWLQNKCLRLIEATEVLIAEAYYEWYDDYDLLLVCQLES